MEFADEMNAFIDWLETNPLEPSAQTLWVHLLVIANKSGYPEWFAVANPLLQAKVGISEKSLTKHRNTLVQKGLIEYKNQGKQQAGKYRMNLLTEYLTGNFTVNRGVKCTVNRGVKGAVKPSAYKDLKDFNSSLSPSITPSHARDENYESFYAAHERAFGFPVNQFQGEQLAKYIDEDRMDEAVVVHAIERAAFKSKGYRFGFIVTILQDYLLSGIRTMEGAIAQDAQFDKAQRRREETCYGKPKRRAERVQPGRNPKESEFAFLDAPEQNRTGTRV